MHVNNLCVVIGWQYDEQHLTCACLATSVIRFPMKRMQTRGSSVSTKYLVPYPAHRWHFKTPARMSQHCSYRQPFGLHVYKRRYSSVVMCPETKAETRRSDNISVRGRNRRRVIAELRMTFILPSPRCPSRLLLLSRFLVASRCRIRDMFSANWVSFSYILCASLLSHSFADSDELVGSDAWPLTCFSK